MQSTEVGINLLSSFIKKKTKSTTESVEPLPIPKYGSQYPSRHYPITMPRLLWGKAACTDPFYFFQDKCYTNHRTSKLGKK